MPIDPQSLESEQEYFLRGLFGYKQPEINLLKLIVRCTYCFDIIPDDQMDNLDKQICQLCQECLGNLDSKNS